MVEYKHFSEFSLSPQLDLKSGARVPFFLHPFILIASFTLSPTPLFPPSMWTSQENSMCTFSLIKGLDTLPYPRRKAPFISPYWIFLSVSVLFNFAPPFVFITGQQKESVGNRDKGTCSLSVSPWAMIRLGWSALPAQCSALFLHHRWHPDPPLITRKHPPWLLIVATHWLKGQNQQVWCSGHNGFCTSAASQKRGQQAIIKARQYASNVKSSIFEFLDSLTHLVVLECKACGYEVKDAVPKDRFQTNH